MATILGIDSYRSRDIDTRLAAQDDIERLVSEVTRHRNADDLAKQLQYAGIEAVPVVDFEDLAQRDPQLQLREHFIRIDRPVTGESIYERNGFRLSAATSSFDRPSPLLGEHNDDILVAALGYDSSEVDELRESGALM